MFVFHPMAFMLNELRFALLVLNFKNKLKGRVGYVSIHSWGTFEVQSATIGAKPVWGTVVAIFMHKLPFFM